MCGIFDVFLKDDQIDTGFCEETCTKNVPKIDVIDGFVALNIPDKVLITIDDFL